MSFDFKLKFIIWLNLTLNWLLRKKKKAKNSVVDNNKLWNSWITHLKRIKMDWYCWEKFKNKNFLFYSSWKKIISLSRLPFRIVSCVIKYDFEYLYELKILITSKCEFLSSKRETNLFLFHWNLYNYIIILITIFPHYVLIITLFHSTGKNIVFFLLIKQHPLKIRNPKFKKLMMTKTKGG